MLLVGICYYPYLYILWQFLWHFENTWLPYFKQFLTISDHSLDRFWPFLTYLTPVVPIGSWMPPYIFLGWSQVVWLDGPQGQFLYNVHRALHCIKTRWSRVAKMPSKPRMGNLLLMDDTLFFSHLAPDANQIALDAFAKWKF